MTSGSPPLHLGVVQTVLRGGTVYDGRGGPARVADVAIRDGRVAGIGDRISGDRSVDCSGRWVMPGFVDIHTHYDAEVEALPALDESLRHGVTTVVFGNCSYSVALGRPAELTDLFSRVENLSPNILAEWMGGRPDFRDPADYYQHLEALALGPNVASFLGHSNLRIAAMGLDRSLAGDKPTADELREMSRLLESAMQAGFLGLSIDQLPWHRMAGAPHAGLQTPSNHARFGEVRALCEVVRRHGRALQATPNALDKVSVVLLGLLSAGVFKRPLKTTVLAAIDVIADRSVRRLSVGLARLFNRFFRADFRWQTLSDAFDVWSDGPVTPLFEELLAGADLMTATASERAVLLRDPDFRRRFKREWLRPGARAFHRNLDCMKIVAAPDCALVGKTFAEVAELEGVSPLDALLDLFREHDTRIRWKTRVANDRPEIRRWLFAQPETLPGFSDAGAHNRNMAFHDSGLAMLRQVVASPDHISVEAAIAKLTRAPAEWLGLDTGTITPGAVADIIVLDPTALAAGGSAPLELKDPRLGGEMRMVKRSDPVVERVYVGGRLAWQHGHGVPDLGRKRFGRLLRAGASVPPARWSERPALQDTRELAVNSG